eukprot:4825892-Pyramimonas_sp.AAC.1
MACTHAQCEGAYGSQLFSPLHSTNTSPNNILILRGSSATTCHPATSACGHSWPLTAKPAVQLSSPSSSASRNRSCFQAICVPLEGSAICLARRVLAIWFVPNSQICKPAGSFQLTNGRDVFQPAGSSRSRVWLRK